MKAVAKLWKGVSCERKEQLGEGEECFSERIFRFGQNETDEAQRFFELGAPAVIGEVRRHGRRGGGRAKCPTSVMVF